MGYFTVIAKSDRNGYTKIFKGVKAKSLYEAVNIIAPKLCKSNKWSYDGYMSKRRPRRYKHAKHTNKLRKPWAVLAKNSKRQHFNVLNAWSNLHYARLTYLAWEDDSPPVFPVIDRLKELFGEFRDVTDLAVELSEVMAEQTPNTKEKVEVIVVAHYEGQAQ